MYMLFIHCKDHLIVEEEKHTQALFSCEKCAKSFTRKNRLNIHIKTQHTQGYQSEFKCETCKKLFSEKGNLKVHARIHAEIKPFVCKHCLKLFTSLGNKNDHERRHESNRQLKCKHCEKCYYRRYLLTAHMEKHHKRIIVPKGGVNCKMELHTSQSPFKSIAHENSQMVSNLLSNQDNEMPLFNNHNLMVVSHEEIQSHAQLHTIFQCGITSIKFNGQDQFKLQDDKSINHMNSTNSLIQCSTTMHSTKVQIPTQDHPYEPNNQRIHLSQNQFTSINQMKGDEQRDFLCQNGAPPQGSIDDSNIIGRDKAEEALLSKRINGSQGFSTHNYFIPFEEEKGFQNFDCVNHFYNMLTNHFSENCQLSYQVASVQSENEEESQRCSEMQFGLLNQIISKSENECEEVFEEEHSILKSTPSMIKMSNKQDQNEFPNLNRIGIENNLMGINYLTANGGLSKGAQ